MGQLTDIETVQGEHRYGYDKARKLIRSEQPGQKQHNYWFDPAGNRLFNDPRQAIGAQQEKERWAELVRQNVDNPQFNLLDSHMQGQDTGKPFCWMDNRILADGKYFYKYDQFGNMVEKYSGDKAERHRYGYDTNQRLIRYAHETPDKTMTARYFYDPFGRRIARQTQELGQEGKPASELKTSYYGWDGDRLVLTEEGGRHTHTIYEPNSFIPLIRIEGPKRAPMQTLGQKFAQHTGIKLNENQVGLFNKIEQQLRANRLDPEIEHYLYKTGTTPQMMRNLLDDWPTLEGKTFHFYHCDHLGTPMALISQQGEIDWQIELDPWGNTIKEHNPKNLHQPIRFQGQHWDEESGLHYNRHRYYDPQVGRYVTQDPIGLEGGLNLSAYVEGNPLQEFDPYGLDTYVTVWQPVGWGESSFGHVSTDINGTTYSFGPKGMATMPTSEYIGLNGFRDGMAVKLKLTPEQEKKLQDCMSKPQGKYSALFNRCDSPIQRCLKEVGIDTDSQILPVSLGNKLLDIGVVDGAKEYPANRPASGSSAPWAK